MSATPSQRSLRCHDISIASRAVRGYCSRNVLYNCNRGVHSCVVSLVQERQKKWPSLTFVGLSAWLLEERNMRTKLPLFEMHCSKCGKLCVTNNLETYTCFLCTQQSSPLDSVLISYFAVRCSGCNAVILRQDSLPFTCGQCMTQPISYSIMKPVCLKCGADWCEALDFSPIKENSGLCKRCQK